jgi:uncharacterized protein YbaP (TraB family)
MRPVLRVAFAETCILALACAGPPAPKPCSPESAGVPLAYEVHAPDGAQAFLQGSMHLVRGEPPALHPRVVEGLRDSKVLVLEIDPSQATPQDVARVLMDMALLPKGTSLRDVVSPDTWNLLESRAKSAHADLEPLEIFEPWVVAMSLMIGSLTHVGFEAQGGTERQALGEASGKETLGLETVTEQLQLFDALSPEVQEELLRSVLTGDLESLDQLEDLASAWRCGDTAGIESVLHSEEYSHPELAAFYDATIYARNPRMAAGIEKILGERGSGAFVIVGAAHLVGSRGIPALLEQAGYRVEQMRR